MNLLSSLRKEILEAWRSKRFLVAVILLGAFGMMSPLLAKFMREIFTAVPGAEAYAFMIPEQTVVDAIAQYVKNIEQFGLLLALLLSMGLVAVEKERGTAALMLSKPLGRGNFILSKFLGVAVLLLVALLVAALGGWYYTYYLFEPLPAGAWLALNGAMLMVFLVMAAITLLFSTLFNSQAAAAGAGLGTYLLISLLGSSPTLAPYTQGYLVNWGMGLFSGGTGAAWASLGVCLGLIVISLTTACLVFRRQEL